MIKISGCLSPLLDRIRPQLELNNRLSLVFAPISLLLWNICLFALCHHVQSRRFCRLQFCLILIHKRSFIIDFLRPLSNPCDVSISFDEEIMWSGSCMVFVTTSSVPNCLQRTYFSSETVNKLKKTPCHLRNPNVYFRVHKTVSVACSEIQISYRAIESKRFSVSVTLCNPALYVYSSQVVSFGSSG